MIIHLHHRYHLYIFIILILVVLKSNCDNDDNNATINLWNDTRKVVGLLIKNCIRHEHFKNNGTTHHRGQFWVILDKCLKRGCLLALDITLEHDVIELGNGIELVRKGNETASNRRFEIPPNDYNYGMVDVWKRQFLPRIAYFFNTHVLKIHLDTNDRTALMPEARRRRKDNIMMSLVMFGIVAVAMIMIPMGFQFLTVLGGKALLLAKMALILSAIQGLKRIATSNYNYGLYDTTPIQQQQQQQQWQFDRKWPYDNENQATGTSFNYYKENPHNYGTDLLHPKISRIFAEN